MEFVNQVWAIASVRFLGLKTAFLNSLVTDVTRVKITQTLGPWTICAEQKEAVLKSALLKLVARTSSRVFLGDVGCRNPAWLNITKEFTVNSLIRLRVINPPPC
ncbi:ent-kaurene oxidase [Colletotrichum costaricense]|uniref:Ent-kaurene oxidase n=1 Tax=Colletotrichum costaricense TaxID=1209916 RepID=A0AAI9YY37_9PEZI|nr:ent-kaurene oxidase [Colletotrichum costaricense]KAK1528391.1 ent-kaurene oxidase [Colletotrichum costaricense]